ncbi:MAG TPA: RNA 2',3'-cyclic phosphodiesterase [Vicinamibacterales bacterium]|nr:RNA 2',3'-cyclic phosphodiesterase [Vicinamibacterales bacterium]
MRLFVAVEIDEAARAVARAAQERLQIAVPPVLRARWVPPENMHLTVRFIGHVDDARAQALIEALTPPIDAAPFDIELGGCGTFPTGGTPRVVWIGLKRGLASLAQLHDAFNQRLRPFGFEPEARPFSAHLTLARVKDAPRGSGRAVRDALSGIQVPATPWHVSHSTVFQSHPSPKGPRYVAIGRTELKTGGL